jgi:hypothetical protein
MATVIEIDVDNPRNGCLHFLPLGRTIRGRIDFNRDSEPQARVAGVDYPDGVPGQRLGIDLDSLEGYIVEPLHEKAHEKTLATIRRKGFQPPAARETFKLSPADKPTWLYWLKRSVEAGHAKLAKGKFPDRIDGDPQKTFISKPRGPDPKDAVIARLTAILMAKLSPAERREVEAIIHPEG